jgi:hypothetical protein
MNLSDEYLGLDYKVYEDIIDQVTDIVHSAYCVNVSRRERGRVG